MVGSLMRFRLILPLMALLAIALAAPAQARYSVGLSEQDARVFANPDWRSLHLKQARFILAWDWYKTSSEVGEVDAYMRAAQAHKQDVLVTFSAHRGCFVNNHYSKAKVCRAPSAAAFRSSVKRFHAKYSYAKSFAAWNEANHISQPTYRKPKLAVRYYNVVRGVCSRCKIVAADVLDSSDVATYLRGFLRASHGRGRIWGLHNYKDVNRHQTKGLTTLLRTVPGQVWLTETGGIVKLAPSFPFSETRAATATKYLFQLANRYDSKRRGNRSRLSRVYVYRFFGESSSSRFDAGLVTESGKRRPAYAVFKKAIG